MNAEPHPPALQCVGLSKSFGGRPLFHIPALTLPAAHCILLKGPNGAGKTTLMKILAGLEPPDSGVLKLDGHPLSWEAARRYCRRQVIYVHQQPFVFDRSVADNVAYGLRQAGWPRRQIRATVSEALAWAGLAHLAERNARGLSGGEKQRVTLTRARVLQPRLLLLDEPTASLDQAAREQAHAMVRRLRDEGMGILISSHDLQQITPLADVVLTLDAGRLSQGEATEPRPRLVFPGPATASAVA